MFWNIGKKYNILILGCNGMLGKELYERFTEESINSNSIIGKVIGIDKSNSFDITNTCSNSIATFLLHSIKFDYCINCIAYTDTKSAEFTDEGKKLSYQLNALAPKRIAEACLFFGIKLIHISTDYVFSEYDISNETLFESTLNSRCIYAEPFPKNIYGLHKLIGELNVKEVFNKKPKDYVIARTSWLYGKHGNKSFIHKFIKNLAKELKNISEQNNENTDQTSLLELPMTQNEYSIPTSCKCVYDHINAIIKTKTYGIVHAIPDDYNKVPSRLDFANEILRYFHNDKMFGINVSEVKLKGVDNNSFYPVHSALLTHSEQYFYTISCLFHKVIRKKCSILSWKEYLDIFLNANKYDILKWAVGE